MHHNNYNYEVKLEKEIEFVKTVNLYDLFRYRGELLLFHGLVVEPVYFLLLLKVYTFLLATSCGENWAVRKNWKKYKFGRKIETSWAVVLLLERRC